jgi:signal transduction histidine kinase
VLFNDITARKQAEKNLQALAADLAESNRRKDEFLAVLAHELRNPLAPIRNAVEIMHLHGGLPQELGDLVGMVDRQVGHLTRLVDDLLEVSRIAGGKVELRKHQIALEAPLHDAVESVQPLMKAANHELSVDVPHGIYIDADKTRITQIFLNLLNNAAKFTPRGGRIQPQRRRR